MSVSLIPEYELFFSRSDRNTESFDVHPHFLKEGNRLRPYVHICVFCFWEKLPQWNYGTGFEVLWLYLQRGLWRDAVICVMPGQIAAFSTAFITPFFQRALSTLKHSCSLSSRSGTLLLFLTLPLPVHWAASLWSAPVNYVPRWQPSVFLFSFFFTPDPCVSISGFKCKSVQCVVFCYYVPNCTCFIPLAHCICWPERTQQRK